MHLVYPDRAQLKLDITQFWRRRGRSAESITQRIRAGLTEADTERAKEYAERSVEALGRYDRRGQS